MATKSDSQNARRQARRRVRDAHDGAHALVDGDGPGARLGHQAAEDVVEQETALDVLALRFERDVRVGQVGGGAVAGPLDGGFVGLSRLDQLPQFLVRDGLKVHLPLGPREVRRGGRGPAARAADADNAGPQRVLQTAQRPQPPRDVVLRVHHHVGEVRARDGQRVSVLAEEARRDDLVPQVQRPRLVADEEDDGLAGGEGRLERALRAAGRVDQQGIGRVQVRDGLELVRVPHGRNRQNLEGEVGAGLEGGQFRLDALDLSVGVGLRLDAAPRTPTPFRPPPIRAVGEDRLDDKGLPRRDRFLHRGTSDGLVGAASQGGRTEHHARGLQKRATRDTARIAALAPTAAVPVGRIRAGMVVSGHGESPWLKRWFLQHVAGHPTFPAGSAADSAPACRSPCLHSTARGRARPAIAFRARPAGRVPPVGRP